MSVRVPQSGFLREPEQIGYKRYTYLIYIYMGWEKEKERGLKGLVHAVRKDGMSEICKAG